jgi:hypothetical protein
MDLNRREGITPRQQRSMRQSMVRRRPRQACLLLGASILSLAILSSCRCRSVHPARHSAGRRDDARTSTVGDQSRPAPLVIGPSELQQAGAWPLLVLLPWIRRGCAAYGNATGL